MSIFKKIYYFFSFYTDPSERKIGKFFSKVEEKNVNKKLLFELNKLVQDNLVVINLWTERTYKGYDYLTKDKRKQLYSNVELIKSDFNKYIFNNLGIDFDEIIYEIKNLGLSTQKVSENKDKFIYLKLIMKYLSVDSGRYTYRESSTFGELLKDPTKHTLVGDCNQIVTLYIYLYSLKYDVNDLKLVTFPGHVALNFFGVDIEATSGIFCSYNKSGQKILPIVEIISINLLDITDTYFKTHKVDPGSYLQSARLAYVISTEKEIVNKNLEIAYNNIVSDSIANKDFYTALKYARMSKNKKLENITGHNGAIYYLNKNDFTAARKYASYAENKKELEKSIYYKQAITYFDKGDYNNAITAFKNVGDFNLVKKCYEGLYINEQKKLGNIKTSEDVKQNSQTIHNMQEYARKSENKQMMENVRNLAKYL